MNIEAQIRGYVAKNLLFSDNEFEYDNDASFLKEGIVDSIGVMELVTFVGTHFGITIEPHEITPDNFDSVNKLTAYIQRKGSFGQPSPQPVPARTREQILVNQ